MRLEDKEGRCVIKVVGREAILRAREEERQVGEASWAGALLVWCGVYMFGRGVRLSVCSGWKRRRDRRRNSGGSLRRLRLVEWAGEGWGTGPKVSPLRCS